MTTAATVLSIALAAGAIAPPGAVQVDVQATDVDGKRDPTMEDQLEQKLADALTDRGLNVAEGDAAKRIVVAVHRTDVIDYDVEVTVELDGDAAQPGVAPFSCGSCRVVELHDRVLEQVPAMVDALESEAGPAPDPVEPLDAATDAEPSAPAATSSDEPGRARAIGPLGITGAIVGAAGLGAVTYGGILLARDETSGLDVTDERFNVRESYDRPGWTWLGVGLGALLAGGTMLAVDLTVLRKRRDKQVAVHPAAGPTFTGVTIHARF